MDTNNNMYIQMFHFQMQTEVGDFCVTVVSQRDEDKTDVVTALTFCPPNIHPL